MNATAPPKPAVILATPINVEESRAQRLQRQQARFRDRGGIFVPTNRSTLLDILLGKASPLKKPRRSASASPSRAKSTDNEVSTKPALRRSPRKQSQKTIDVVAEEQPLALTDVPESEVSKPVKKATSSKSSKSRPQKETKAPPKRTKKPRDGISVVDDSAVDTSTANASKGTIDASGEISLKVSTKKIIRNADEVIEDDVSLVKSKAKGKAVNKTKLKVEVDGAKGASKTRGKPAATSAAATRSTRLQSSRKAKPSYSELSEDDVACMPTKKAAIMKVKKAAPPPDIPKEDEEKGLPSIRGVEVSLLNGIARPVKSLNAYDDDGGDDIKKSKSKVTSSQGKPQDDSAYKPTKKSSTKKVLEDDVACKPAKRSTKESDAPMKEEKFKSLEEHNLAKEDTPLESTSKAVAASKGKKRAIAPIAQDSDSQLRRKLIKSGTTDIDPSLHKNSNLSAEAPLVPSKKRRRNPKDAESEVEDGVDKGIKRRKHSSSSESRQSPEITVEEDSVKPVVKRSRKMAKSTRKGRKPGSDTTTTSKLKENAPMSKPSKVSSNSGPPKSVLQRIKNSLSTQVVDNEPDPIDFLSRRSIF